jgi:hypothetical protein
MIHAKPKTNRHRQTPFVQRIDGKLYEFRDALELQTALCRRSNGGPLEAPVVAEPEPKKETDNDEE